MERLDIHTRSHAEFRDITGEVREVVKRSGIKTGVANIFVAHTTAGLTINENADPDVQADIAEALDRLVPWRQSFYQHSEGNSAAHVKASLMGFSATILIEGSAPALGTWQNIYLCEFDGPRSRQVWVQCVGASA
jgi:secondary thiamine-phosphate synthase enzyme